MRFAIFAMTKDGMFVTGKIIRKIERFEFPESQSGNLKRFGAIPVGSLTLF